MSLQLRAADPSSFLVIGAGLSAGMGNFSLSEVSQRHSFPAQMARQLGISFQQPLFQAPGIGSAPGFPSLPVRVPAPGQSIFFERIPPPPVSNLSVPGYSISDALLRTPTPPLIQQDDPVQTACNLILGIRDIATGASRPLLTQVQEAARRNPALVLAEFGYEEALEAAIRADPSRLCPPPAWIQKMEQTLQSLPGVTVIVLSVPDPFDTAYFSAVEVAARLLKIEPSFLISTFGCCPEDWVPLPTLHEMAFQLFGRRFRPLGLGSFVANETAAAVQAWVLALNTALARASVAHGAHFFDLHGLFQQVARNGVQVGSRALNGSYLGGFYCLNGYYPGATGHAIIANELLARVGELRGAPVEPLDLDEVTARDSVASYHAAAGRNWSREELRGSQSEPASAIAVGSAVAGKAPHSENGNVARRRDSARLPIQLPATLEQEISLSPPASYFGDGISALDCEDPVSIMWGNASSLLFGGLAMVDSHLSGTLEFRFTPISDDRARFELSFGQGLRGDDTVLAAPLLFSMPFLECGVFDVPGKISAGEFNLKTGEVTSLRVFAQYDSTALRALVKTNPSFPRDPLCFVSFDIAQPTEYGSAWARFEQREDGKLDFLFYGTRYVPLRDRIVWPLNFVGPQEDFATIPAAGTVMHPHLHLSTREMDAPTERKCPSIPFNTFKELTLHTRRSAFGDAFLLDIPELGGPAKGRSHVLGRLQVQFGLPSGRTVPVAIHSLGPGGVFVPREQSPVSESFPGFLPPGPTGFYEYLRFPRRTYALDELAILDDPFDLAIGAVDLTTGAIVGEHLHRGFIHQDLIYALLRIEPRTPHSSFLFRGPAEFVRGPNGCLGFRYRGEVHVPYPEGFQFPQPNLSTAYTVCSPSALDPFLWLRAFENGRAVDFTLRGQGDAVSSLGDRFSYRYEICANPAHRNSQFEYVNHSQGGSFQMCTLAWVGFSNSLDSTSREGEYDTATFSCFGWWTKNGRRSLEQASVQICKSGSESYIGIQIDSGDVSNVNSKPEEEKDALP